LAFHRGLKPCPPPHPPLRDENGLSTGAAEEKDEGTHNPTTGGAALAKTSGAYFDYIGSAQVKRRGHVPNGLLGSLRMSHVLLPSSS
jgi:hypothetical protein